MRIPTFRLKRSKPAVLDGQEAVRSAYSKFQRIQKLNTKILECIARMECALGGGYIFDRAFLESSVRKLSTDTHHVAYSLNALSGNRYPDLFDRLLNIKSALEDILGGGLGPFSNRVAMPYTQLRPEMEPLVGTLNVCLAEIRHHLHLSAPDGFAVTATGCRRFFEHNGLYKKVNEGGRNSGGLLFAEAEMPDALTRAIERELQALQERRGRDIRYSVRARSTGGGLIQPVLRDVSDVSGADVLSSCRRALAEFVTALEEDGLERLDELSVALTVCEAIPVQVVGSISGLGPAGSPSAFFSVEAAPVDAPDRCERYLLRRVYPFDLIRSEIAPKSLEEGRTGKRALSPNREGLCHGSALVGPAFLKVLAQCAVSVERMLGYAQEIRWGRTDLPVPVILDVQPCQVRSEGDYPSDELAAALREAEVLMRGGVTAQSGVAAGRVVHISHESSSADIPLGAVVVARQASPDISPILRRAGALITEIGTSTGHLATIAREFRVPAIMGARTALSSLPQGIEVTVDAGDAVVYRGTIEALFSYRSSGADFYPTDPEYVILRRLLGWIMPLNLIDPESADFTPQNCRTLHDIIHFAHERSVEELISIQERGEGGSPFQTCRLDLDVPLEIFVLDIDRGLSGAPGMNITAGEVQSEPFKAFLDGVTCRAMWRQAPAEMGFRDILSGLDRTSAVLASHPEYAGRNLAVIARHYMNVSLRLGYHFSVIDAHLSDNLNQNYVYFRFAGGFADEDRRRRRAELIRRILEGMGFKVVLKGDLVVGKLKIADREETAAVLRRLGELTAFTRQLDTAMATDETVADSVGFFLRKAGSGEGLGK